MTNWQRWLQAPHTVFFRRMLFQLHLWVGIACGFYVVMISITGSAIVLRPQFSSWFTHNQVVSTEGMALTGVDLEARIAGVYANATITRVAESTREGRATYVAMEKDGKEVKDPKTGKTKQSCKEVKQHKKLEGTKVPGK
jgi:uncharacterized iron-regulated membrane protein